MNINTYNPAPVFGYNTEGKKHRAPMHVLIWLDKEIAESEQQQAEFNQRAKEGDYDDYDLEISRHEQDGWVACLQHVRRYLEARID